MKALRLVLLALVAVAVAVLASAHAQTLLLALDTPTPQEGANFGHSLAVGDVNNDGNADIAVGSYQEDVGGNADQGRAYVFSGADGSLLFTLDTPNPQGDAYFGHSLAVGEVNGDGKPDIAVGAPMEDVGGNADQGRAYVFSGGDASLLLTLDTPGPQALSWFGYSLAMGDVNSDSKADIAVGAHTEDVAGTTDQGRVYVFSGADGSLLFTLDTPNPQAYAWFGVSVAVGEVNADGKADIAVGAYGEDVGGNGSQGRAYVFSGADGSLLFTLDTPNPWWGSYFGRSLALGQVNDDNKGDIAVGAVYEDVGDNIDQGQAYVFSGADGSPLFTLETPNPQAYANFGHSLAVGDVDDDGKADIAVGAPREDVAHNDQGRAYVFSGADASLLFTLDTPNPQASVNFGRSVAVGDTDADGKGDVAVGAPRESAAYSAQGRAYVFSASDPPPPTPTPPVSPAPVGGIAELPDAPDSAASDYIALAALAAAALLAFTASAWYVRRRRWLG
ncbi:MAG: hypothetical protein AMJ77_03470 [Dehalococcoidia bacterium SM23_28_2]|nr:MAG: hypothetical protein AMJ77_03470 [Dehalococcoidia bacterium SM23_28_2]